MRKALLPLLWLLALPLALPAHATEGGVERLRQTGKAFAAVARAVAPSVVFIRSERKASAPSTTRSPSPHGEQWPFGDDLFRRFFGDRFPGVPESPRPETPRGERRALSQGSGFVFTVKDADAGGKTYILTNNHVVEDADSIRVNFQDGREYDAEITGRDPQSDLAVIEIDADGLSALPLADSSAIEVGEWVIAVGNPFGLNHTFTVGIVSATGRTGLGINDYEDFIQTDAAINPGNSGGPLVNLDGEVVGINTAIFSRSGGYMGVGFAIPSNLASTIAAQLIGEGRVTRGFLGIVIQQLTSELAESFGIDPGAGILVAQVSPDSPAAGAGLRQGDVILEYRGKPVSDVGSFRNQVSLTPPGSREQLMVLRDGKQLEIEVKIGTLEPAEPIAAGAAAGAGALGLTVQTLTPALAEQFGARSGEGVVVTAVRPGSAAAAAGIGPGTIVLQVNRTPVASAEDFTKAVGDSSRDQRVLLLLRKDEVQRYVALKW